MKLERTKYLEFVVHHKDFTLYEYPSRFCVIRIPFDKFIDYNGVFELSLGQVRKLFSIGYFDNPDDYIAVGRRPFDRELIDYKTWPAVFRYSCLDSFNKYKSFFN